MLIIPLRPTGRKERNTRKKTQERVKVLRQPKVVQREDERLQHLW